MSLKILFDAVRKKSEKINQNNPDVDGLKFWTPLKLILDVKDLEAKSWKRITKTIQNDVLSIVEYHVNGKGEEFLVENAHFIIQTVRIPLNNKPSLRKIIQVALNIGQCQGKGTPEYKKHLRGRTKLSDYINDQDICRLSKLIPKKTVSDILNYLQLFEK